ncbi:hypothetical protein SmJEL517_g03332 [Synchytrium microbalum]|uniref:Chloride channel protein n=1 Tax=Synchytrium microbalum TaxID=1806994 RepID=A0A507C8M4_9FUNG|nr:uncharacterized protein SmJEL517_g03332 [Synchytrium microbalum]TPX33883.1 hypothetical protein SmJEL517_g03332 [Synchytrium microbalum]
MDSDESRAVLFAVEDDEQDQDINQQYHSQGQPSTSRSLAVDTIAASAIRPSTDSGDSPITFEHVGLPQNVGMLGRQQLDASLKRKKRPSIGFLNVPRSVDQLRVRMDDQPSNDWMTDGTGRRVVYQDFTTIDWIYDFAKERQRVRKLMSLEGWKGQWTRVFDASQAWLLVGAVGLLMGLLAGSIDIATAWLSDTREGFCSAGFYLNHKFCCWHVGEYKECDEWVTWGQVFAWTDVGRWGMQYLMFTILGGLFAGICAILVKNYAPYAAGSGIPEIKTILGGFVIRSFLGGWTLLIKTLGLVLSVGSGLSVGKEGPYVHLACCLGNILPRIFDKYANNEAKMREILSAASSAGISVAFGAPIGGVLFSLEEVSYYFPYKTMWRSFFGAMIAAITLQLMNPFRTGKMVLFQVTYDRNWHGFEMFLFVFLGVLGGLYGAYFIRMNLRVAMIRRTSWLRLVPVSEVVLLAVITSIICFNTRFLRVPTVDLLANLFRECEEVEGDFHGLCTKSQGGVTAGLLIITALVKAALTTVTFGVRVPSGILLPSMAVGACVGRVVGMGAQYIQETNPTWFIFSSCPPGGAQCVTPGTYAMVGAAAFLGGVTRMTVSLAVIMFEFTGALTYILPVMVTIMVAKFVGDAFGAGGIYDALVRLNSYPYLDPREEYGGRDTAAGIMTRVQDLEVVTATEICIFTLLEKSTGHTINSLDELLKTTDYKGFPVVTDFPGLGLVGYAGRAEMRYAIDQARLQSDIIGSSPCYFSDMQLSGNEAPHVDMRVWIDQTPMTVSPRYPIELVLELFAKLGLRYVIVAVDNRLVGLITKKDLLRHVVTSNHPEFEANPMEDGPTTGLNRESADWTRAAG